jgi:hypothetical protein
MKYPTCNSYYGYEIYVPKGSRFIKFLKKIDLLNSIVKEPFKICGLLCSFSLDFDDTAYDEEGGLDKKMKIVIGFEVRDNL